MQITNHNNPCIIPVEFQGNTVGVEVYAEYFYRGEFDALLVGWTDGQELTVSVLMDGEFGSRVKGEGDDEFLPELNWLADSLLAQYVIGSAPLTYRHGEYEAV